MHECTIEFTTSKMATPDPSQEVARRPQGVVPSNAQREAKRQATKAIKRRTTLIGKADELHNQCGYKVLLVLQKGHRSYIYTSVDTPDVTADLVSLLPHQLITS